MKKMKFEMKKNEVWNEKKWSLKWKKWSLKKRKLKNMKKWKNDNENENENEVTNENPNEKNEKIILNISNLWLDANHIKLG